MTAIPHRHPAVTARRTLLALLLITGLGVSLGAGLGGCAVVTVAGAAAGAAISVAGAVVSTGVAVTGKVVTKTIDVITPAGK